MNRFYGFCLLLAACSAFAAPFNPVQELAKQTGLSVTKLNVMIKSCDANQANTNICARYEQIKTERGLQQVVTAKRIACPNCSAVSKKNIVSWERQRDKMCKATARHECGSGSMEPAAESMCITAVTKKKMASIRKTDCGQRGSRAAKAAGNSLPPKTVKGNVVGVSGH